MNGDIKARAGARLILDNPWWGWSENVYGGYEQFPRRSYFANFHQWVSQCEVNRAVVLMGPRRVGKTVMMFQSIAALINEGVESSRILFASLETPAYAGLWPEDLLNLLKERTGSSQERLYLFFDEIQYFKDWEIHLKSLVDTYPQHRFVVSGSAAAALKMASKESGLGRFFEFTLPPLLFSEYLHIKHYQLPGEHEPLSAEEIRKLNRAFFDYINYGGFPELVYQNPTLINKEQLLKDDILDKALQRDLPALYGIENVRDVYRLFSTVAFHVGKEFTYEGLSQESGLDKETIRKYLTFLEAAFLIRIVNRLDENAREFKRNTAFKAYLTNTTMRTALFGPVDPDTVEAGHIVEAAVFVQVFSYSRNTYYARWKNADEVDMVLFDNPLKPYFAAEVKWSDDLPKIKSKLGTLVDFITRHIKSKQAFCTTRTVTEQYTWEGVDVSLMPAAWFVLQMSERGPLRFADAFQR